MQITQRADGVPIHQVVLKRPSGHDPGKPAVGHSGSAWVGGWLRWSPEVPSHFSHVWFWDYFCHDFSYCRSFFPNDKTARGFLSPLTSNKMKKYLSYKYKILILWLFMQEHFLQLNNKVISCITIVQIYCRKGGRKLPLSYTAVEERVHCFSKAFSTWS